MYITPPGYAAALRAVGEMLYSLMLETPAEWPGWPESSTRTEMRAAVADLRHLQGFLRSVGSERELSSLDAEDALPVQPRGQARPASSGSSAGWIERELAGARCHGLGLETLLSPGRHAQRLGQGHARQKSAWEVAASRHGKASAGAFLAWAGDLYLTLQRAYHDAIQAHDDALNPVGYAEEVKRGRSGRGSGEGRASFTVHATAEQSIRWKRAAEAEGHRSAGTWLAAAADAYLRVRARAGQPLALAWHLGAFTARLMDGREVQVRGMVVAAVRRLPGHVSRAGPEQAAHPGTPPLRPHYRHAPKLPAVPRSCGGAGPRPPARRAAGLCPRGRAARPRSAVESSCKARLGSREPKAGPPDRPAAPPFSLVGGAPWGVQNASN